MLVFLVIFVLLIEFTRNTIGMNKYLLLIFMGCKIILAYSVASITHPNFQIKLGCMNSKWISPVCLKGPWNITNIFRGHGTEPHG